ncbi:MAG: DUF11 domain-containing protein [Oscillospiraceae bacterium]|jgi:hypothetical protein|nr:DUF11 domain-containing protein [Oscillospiraceae bacterium]
MKKVSLALCLALLALLVGMAAAHADYDPITVSASCSPKSLAGVGTVEVTVSVSNNADGDFTSTIELLDPNNEPVSWFGKVSLSNGQNKKASGSWRVTADQLAAGKIIYKLRYQALADAVGDAAPEKISKTRSISIGISKATPTAKLTADYTVSPTSASKGQTVTFTYTLSNTSNLDATNIQITNPNITDKTINIESIPAGGQETRSFNYTMGSKTVKSKPRVTYRAAGSTKVQTITNMPQKTIELAKGGVIVNLKATGETTAAPGSKLDLTVTVTNNSNSTYSKVAISDPVLGEILSDKQIKPKDKLTATKSITIGQTADYAFTVTGEAGKDKLNITSNIVHVIALDPSKMLYLEVSAESDVMTITEEPALVTFNISIKNVGATYAKDLLVAHGKTDIATIPSLAPGEEAVLSKLLRLSMKGKYMFTVSGLDEQGAKQNFDTNELMIAYMAPTPEPPPETPEPFETEDLGFTLPVATEEPAAQSGSGSSAGMTLLYIIAGVLVAGLVAVLVMIFLGRRRGLDAEAEDLDSLERGSRRDYARAPARTHVAPRRREKRGEDLEGDEYAEPFEEPVVSSMHDLAERYGETADGAAVGAEAQPSQYGGYQRHQETVRDETEESVLSATGSYRRRGRHARSLELSD